jgi:hypothetical protein
MYYAVLVVYRIESCETIGSAPRSYDIYEDCISTKRVFASRLGRMVRCHVSFTPINWPIITVMEKVE